MEHGDNDPRRPLLGYERSQPSSFARCLKKTARKLCSAQSWRKRLPISIWLPNYNLGYLLKDAIAGITVALTAIPQGIAYALIAGCPPQVGLYASIFPGLVYVFFGSSPVVTLGPTAVLAALVSKYTVYGVDFAYLASFLTGCVVLLMGVFQLGFLLDLISKPVICGFTTAAALQIGASQLKGLFRIPGKSGGTFIDSVISFFKHINEAHLWDPVLGFVTILALIMLKLSSPTISSSGWRRVCCQWWQYLVRARNALVVFAGALLAFILSIRGLQPFALTGNFQGGLPNFGPPPFSTVVGNKTLDFKDMLSVYGAEGFVMPLVAILESIAIAKAFAGGCSVDGTQEMVALGLCNVISSFCQSLPATGSFTRTALNHASGVVTPAGAFFKASVVLLAVTLLTSWFYFIPKSTLSAVILVAMSNIADFAVIPTLWKNAKLELLVYVVTLVCGASWGLEYGIAAGVGTDIVRELHRAARPQLPLQSFKVGNQDCIKIVLVSSISYASAESLNKKIKKNVRVHPVCIILDGQYLKSIDFGVAENLTTVILDLQKNGHRVLFWNFPSGVQRLLVNLEPKISPNFVCGPSIDQHVLAMNNEMIRS